jgi:RNA polymerase sigma-70 factor (ECF subfamily)
VSVHPQRLAAAARGDDGLIDAVHGAIAALERPCREVLVMRDLEGLSGEATCAALGLTESAMKSRLHRARQCLRAELQRSGDAPVEKDGWN